MDPIAILQNRIEQLEAKLGLYANASPEGQQQGDTVTNNLIDTAQAVNNATVGHEKLADAVHIANELNNYTDPNIVETAVPVLESEPIQQVPEMQATVDHMHKVAAEVKTEADAVSQGIQEIAETCGAAASAASEQLAGAARQVDRVEQKLFPQRRNGLD